MIATLATISLILVVLIISMGYVLHVIDKDQKYIENKMDKDKLQKNKKDENKELHKPR